MTLTAPRWLGCLLALALGVGCSSSSEEQVPLILVAASCADAVAEAAATFAEQGGGEVRISAGASNLLAQQILSGAPADLYLSAHPRWASALQDAGRVERAQPLLTNRLVVVARDRPPLPTADALLQLTRIAVADEHVPAGRYATEALTSAALLNPLQHRNALVRTGHVRAALAVAQRGEVDAAIVYATDARVAPTLTEIFRFAPAMHSPIRYSLVRVRPVVAEAQASAPRADRFEAFLTSPAADSIFARHGFIPSRGVPAPAVTPPTAQPPKALPAGPAAAGTD